MREPASVQFAFKLSVHSRAVLQHRTFDSLTEDFMTQQRNPSLYPDPHHPLPAFQSLLAIGAMMSTFAVIAYACLTSDAGAVRTHVILQGAEVTLLTWAAGAVSSLVHLIGVARERADAQAARMLKDGSAAA